MEVIEKKIILEDFKSRQPSLIPFYGSLTSGGTFSIPTHGNWGQYPYDIDINKCVGFESLKTYFGYSSTSTSSRVSFIEIMNKYHQFQKIFKKTNYYKKVVKGNSSNWVSYEPLFKEVLNIQVFNSLSDGGLANTPLTYIGINKNGLYAELGGLLMVQFLTKAIGLFIVDDRYITMNNYVPDVMYFAGIQFYIDKLHKYKNSSSCCVLSEYEKYGGDEFLRYLNMKLNDVENEKQYWENALYIDEEGHYQTSSIAVSLALNADSHNIGIYSVLENDEPVPDYPSDFQICTAMTTSQLYKLKRTKQSFYYDKIDNVEKELPVILESNETTGNTISFRLTPKYVANIPYNVTYHENDIYGDIIYHISTPNPSSDGGLITINYVIGGRLIKQNNLYSYANDGTGVRYSEQVKYEFNNYKDDFTKEIKMLALGREINILNSNFIVGSNNVLVIHDSENEDVVGTFTMNMSPSMTNGFLIMRDYNFGKTEALIENIEDLVIDRGYSSALELHYKIGEVNSLEDLENYQNNIFKL